MASTYQKMVKKPLMKILSKYLSLCLRQFWPIGHTIDCIFE